MVESIDTELIYQKQKRKPRPSGRGNSRFKLFF
jgi:hypothetical protein